MKTSFYFVLWIIVCMCLLCSTNEFVHENTAFISTIIVFCLYWVISTRASSQSYLLYERKLLRVRSLNNSIDNISNTNERGLNLSSLFCYGVVLFFVISLIFIGYNLVHYSVLDYWWGQTDWFCFIIFAIFSLKISLDMPFRRDNFFEPNTIDETHFLEYKKHVTHSIPKKFRFYKKVNTIFSISATILGVLIGCCAIYFFLTNREIRLETQEIGIACTFYIYGSLAAYYGIKDIISCIRSY